MKNVAATVTVVPDGERRSPMRMAMVLVAAVALMLGSIGATTLAVAQGATPVPAASPVVPLATPAPNAGTCDTLAPGVGAEQWVQTELYFGTTRQDGTAVTSDEFNQFLDDEITPRFPDGLTVLTGYGQWRNAAGEATSETSVVVIILYPADPTGETSRKLQEIRAAYKAEFDQESVLRADTPEVCVSF